MPLSSLTFILLFNKYYAHAQPCFKCWGYNNDRYRPRPRALGLTSQDDREKSDSPGQGVEGKE